MEEKIASFTIDHEKLLRGVYVSRIDFTKEEPITTFDIRMKIPNVEPVLDNPALHAIEHLGATFFRSDEELSKKTIYFGPMGCRTGFYLIFAGRVESKEVVETLKDMFKFISENEGKIPGQSPVECGNYLDLNLPMAKYEAKLFLENTLENIKEENLVYPN